MCRKVVWERDLSWMVLFSDSVVAGAVSGGVTRLLIEPLDVLKVRFQLQLEAIGTVHTIVVYFPDLCTTEICTN